MLNAKASYIVTIYHSVIFLLCRILGLHARSLETVLEDSETGLLGNRIAGKQDGWTRISGGWIQCIKVPQGHGD